MFGTKQFVISWWMLVPAGVLVSSDWGSSPQTSQGFCRSWPKKQIAIIVMTIGHIIVHHLGAILLLHLRFKPVRVRKGRVLDCFSQIFINLKCWNIFFRTVLVSHYKTEVWVLGMLTRIIIFGLINLRCNCVYGLMGFFLFIVEGRLSFIHKSCSDLIVVETVIQVVFEAQRLWYRDSIAICFSMCF